jgi:O-Antigen ligase
VLLGALTGLFFVVLIDRAGPAAALLPLAALIVAFLLLQPRLTLAALLGVVIVIEADPVGLLPIGPSFYSPIRVGQTPPDLLFYILVAGTGLQLLRERSHPRGIGPMTLPALALAAAAIGGLATGYYAGASGSDLLLSGLRLAELLLIPFLVANLLTDEASVRGFLVGAAALAAFKAVTGLLAVATGAGFTVEGGVITYYEPVANWLMLMFLLFVLAARVRRFSLPSWVWWTVPLAVLAFVLSYRRSFWLAAVFALVVVVVIASRRSLRTALAIVAVGLVLVLAGTAALGGSSEVESPVLERARSLQPGSLGEDRGDRYRIDERRNVVAEIEHAPITGLGMNIPWSARYPLSEEHDRNYTHVVLLWYWLKMGLIGVLAFIWLYAVAMWTAFGVWRNHPKELVRLGALAALGGLVALVIVELTASFTGVEPRLTIVFGALLGWIAAAWRQLPRGPTARATASTE